MNAGYMAHAAVTAAVARGNLPKAGTQICVDCGAPAEHYEHRDYARPLEVQPTCRKCNIARGPAKGAQAGEFNTVLGRWLKDLRPNDWHRIWPELIGADGAPAVPLDPAKPTPEPAQESA